MPNTRAINLTRNNIPVIANSGVISIEDAQALYEQNEPYFNTIYFVLDYPGPDGFVNEWTAISLEFFEDNFVWTESPRAGFRHCRRK